MDFKIFDKAALAVALGAARAVEPNPSSEQDALLVAVARFNGVDLYPRLLPKPGVIGVNRALRDARCRRRVLELAVALATSNHGEVRPVVAANLALLARTLDHSDRDVRELRDRANHYYLRARIDFTRRMAARVVRDAWPSEQERGMLDMLSRALQVRIDSALAARYRALADLHPASFGHALWDHFQRNAFRFPGEGGGVPERLLLHDVAHVVSGYSTDPEGELELAAFQTGCLREGDFMPLYVGILQFHFAMRARPAGEGVSTDVDCDKVVTALARGASCRIDLTDDWDCWSLFPQALADVRRALGVAPLAHSAAA